MMLTKFESLPLLQDLVFISRGQHVVARVLTSPQPLQGYGASSTSSGESGYAPMADSVAVAMLDYVLLERSLPGKEAQHCTKRGKARDFYRGYLIDRLVATFIVLLFLVVVWEYLVDTTLFS